MAEVYIGRVKQQIDQVPETVGDLMTALEPLVGAEGLQVTAVRLDGVDEPTFRHPAASRRPLAGVDRIDVETAPSDALLRQCCADAARAVLEMAESVDRLADLFRRTDLRAANASMVRLVADLRTFVTFLQTLKGAPGARVEGEINDLGRWLESLVSAHVDGDWVTVSDVLEYDLAPGLREWRRALDACAEAPAA